MLFQWSIVVDLGIISIGLLVATLIRARVHFLQRFLIPNALIAGFLLLFFYNVLAPKIGIGRVGLENLVYHFLNISFIAMSLRPSGQRAGARNIFATVTTILSQYSLQSLLGMGLTFLFIATFIKNLFPTFGLFITLGYCLGPGQAFSMGSNWESYGFTGGGSVGLTFAAFGFLWAFFGGIILINHARRRGRLRNNHTDEVPQVRLPQDTKPGGGQASANVTPKSEGDSIDSLAYNLAVVLGVHLVAFLFLKLISWFLSFAGPMGEDLAQSFWSIMFIFGALFALLAKKVFRLATIEHTLDNNHLTRISGTTVDIMVAASVAAIELAIVEMYWMPIVIAGILGGLITVVSLLWISSRIFSDHHFHRFILIYGALTGTLPSGLALLRIVDREFATPASRDYVYAAGVAFPFAIPMLMVVNLPAYGYERSNPLYYWITTAVFALYLIGVIITYRVLRGKNAFKTPLSLWQKG